MFFDSKTIRGKFFLRENKFISSFSFTITVATMFARILLGILCLVVQVTGSVQNGPGMVAFWGYTSKSSSGARMTNTKTLTTTDVSTLLSERITSSKPDVVAILTTSDGRGSIQHSSVSSALKEQSASSELMPSVYTAASANAQQSAKAAILSAKGIENLKKMSLNDFLTQIKLDDSAKNPLSNGKMDAYEIVLTGHESEHAVMKDVTTILSGSNVLLVALKEPAAPAPASSLHYARVLAATSSNLIDGIYYKPEGGEYSIYYADTYLYLTPDIFTGLLSGIFFLFAVLIGFTCMNQIQGPSSFTHKEQMPAIGKEA